MMMRIILLAIVLSLSLVSLLFINDASAQISFRDYPEIVNADQTPATYTTDGLPNIVVDCTTGAINLDNTCVVERGVTFTATLTNAPQDGNDNIRWFFGDATRGRPQAFTGSVYTVDETTPCIAKLTLEYPQRVNNGLVEAAHAYSRGFIVNCPADEQPPITPNIAVSVLQQERTTIDFRVISDNVDTDIQLTVVFDTSAAGVTGPTYPNGTTAFLHDQGTFVGLNSTATPPFLLRGISDGDNDIQHARFTVNDDAVPGVYAIPYTATDRDGNVSMGDGMLTVTIMEVSYMASSIDPIMITLTDYFDRSHGGITSVTLLIPDDEEYPFFQPPLAPVVTSRAINTSTVGGQYQLQDPIDEPVPLYLKNLLFDGAFDLEYVVVFSNRGEDDERHIPFTFTAPPNDNTPPTTPDVRLNVIKGTTGTIDFSGVTDGTEVGLTITVDRNNVGNNNPDTFSVTGNFGGVNDFGLTAVDKSITYRPNNDFSASPGLYEISYTAEDVFGNEARGRLFIDIRDPETTPPTTPDITFSVSRGGMGTIDFGVITDNRYDTFDITFRTSGEGVTANNILDHITFLPNVVNGTTSPFMVTADDEMVGFTVDTDAALETFVFPYFATDAENNMNTGDISITFIEPDTIAPMAQPIRNNAINQNVAGTLDFSIVTDNADDIGQLIITFDTDDPGATPGILANGVFSGTNSTDTTPFLVNDDNGMVTFTPIVDATLGDYVIPYTVTDRSGNEDDDMIFMTIIEGTAPTTPPITASLTQGRDDTIDFSGISDNVDTFEQLTITFDLAATSAVGDILAQGSFTAGVDSINATAFRITATTVTFTADANVELGDHSFPYAVTDRAGNTSSDTVTLTLLGPDTILPMAPTITLGVNTGDSVEFGFGDELPAITDDRDSFGELIITLDTTTAILDGVSLFDFIRFTNGVSGTAPTFTIDEQRISFSIDFDGIPGTYTFPYTVTDRSGNESLEGEFEIMIFLDSDGTPPTTPPIPATVSQDRPGSIDFSVISDNGGNFEQLTVTFDTATSNLLDQGSFTSGTNSTNTSPFLVTDPAKVVEFTLGENPVFDTYVIPYTVTDRSGLMSSNDITLILEEFTTPDTTAPTTQDIIVSVNNNEQVELDFSVVDDNRDSFALLAITFDTDDALSVGDILSNGTFTAGGLNGTTTPFRVLSETVTFNALLGAEPGLYSFQYTATDRAGLQSTSTVQITIVDTTNPDAPDDSVMVNQGGRVNIDFSGITDNTDTIDELTITINTDASNATPFILRNGTFTSGVTGTAPSFIVEFTPVQFTTIEGAMIGDYIIPYTVRDRAGNEDTGTITMTVGLDTDAPTPSAFGVSVIRGDSDGVEIDFSDITDDTDYEFSHYTVTFDTNNPGATPNILSNGTFTAGVNGTTTPFLVTDPNGIVIFTPNENARLQDYIILFSVSDRAGNVAESIRLTMSITRDMDPPTGVSAISTSIVQGGNVNIDFSGITDIGNSFENLIIVFDTGDSTATGGNILEQGSFSAGTDSINATAFRVTATTVTFTANTNAQIGDYSFPYTATDRSGNFVSNTITMSITASAVIPDTSEPAPQPRRSGGGGGGGSSGGGGGGGGSGGGSSILNIDSFAPHLAMYDQCGTDGKVRVVASSQSSNLQASIVSNGKTYTGIDVTDRVDASMYITTTSATPFIFDFETEKLNSFVIKMSIDSSSGISYPVNVDECISHKKLFSNAGVNIATPAQPYFEFGKIKDTSAPESNDKSQITESVLKQYKRGVPIDQIVCQDSTNMVLESPSGKPYCMTDPSSVTLIDRGYTLV